MYSAMIQAVSVGCGRVRNGNPAIYSLSGPDRTRIDKAFAALDLVFDDRQDRDDLVLELQSSIAAMESPEKNHFVIRCGHNDAGYWVRAGPKASVVAEAGDWPPLILTGGIRLRRFIPSAGYCLNVMGRHEDVVGLVRAPQCDYATEISTATPSDDPAFMKHGCEAGYLLEIESHVQNYTMRCNGLDVWNLDPAAINFLRSFGIKRLPTWVCPQRVEMDISVE